MKFIALNHCCAKGLEIVLNRDRAWENHNDAEAVRWRVEEQKHLETCAECNPDLQTNAMLTALWGPDVRVSE